MVEFPYVTVDVFTARRFGGNPLAVVTDARGLTTAQMQQIAAEFNYVESTFVLPPQDPENTAQVRVFTRVAEIPFAGHPNVGTGYVLARQRDIFGKPPGSNLRFEEKAGLVEVDIAFNEGTVAGARIKAPQSLETGATMEPDVFAKCASLSVEAIDTTHHIPTVASVGLPFFVAETDSASLATAHANLDAFHSAAARYALAELSGRVSVYVYARLDEGINSLRARMFSPMSGNWEDPATGSAAAALGAFLASLDERTDMTAEIEIAQGVEMGRPSAITVCAKKKNGTVDEITIAGQCAPVMHGVIEI